MVWFSQITPTQQEIVFVNESDDRTTEVVGDAAGTLISQWQVLAKLSFNEVSSPHSPGSAVTSIIFCRSPHNLTLKSTIWWCERGLALDFVVF